VKILKAPLTTRRGGGGQAQHQNIKKKEKKFSFCTKQSYMSHTIKKGKAFDWTQPSEWTQATGLKHLNIYTTTIIRQKGQLKNK